MTKIGTLRLKDDAAVEEYCLRITRLKGGRRGLPLHEQLYAVYIFFGDPTELNCLFLPMVDLQGLEVIILCCMTILKQNMECQLAEGEKKNCLLLNQIKSTLQGLKFIFIKFLLEFVGCNHTKCLFICQSTWYLL